MKRSFLYAVLATSMILLPLATDTGLGAPKTATVSKQASPSAAGEYDWPNWRGPMQDGISLETGLVDEWDLEKGEEGNVLWRNEELGGRSTPIVMGDKLYAIVRADPGTDIEGEKVICVNAATGEKIWENKFNIFLCDVPDTRVGWSSCVADPATGRIYALGVCDLFQCLDGETGETIWSHSLSEEYGALDTYGGRTNFPVVFDDLVIISSIVIGWGDMAKPAHRFLAFDKETGEIVWFNGTRLLPYDTSYSTPQVTTLAGQAAIVFGSGDGAVWAMQPRTGEPIWKYQLSRRGLNVSPIVVDDKVYTGHSEENFGGAIPTMGSVVALDGTGKGDIIESGVIWKHDEVLAGKCSPVLVDGRLYVVQDTGSMYVFDAETGEEIGRRVRLVGSSARSSPLYADGKLYVLSTSAWHVFQPTEDGVKMLNKDRLPRGEECHASPIASAGRIYLTTTGAMYCLGKRDHQPHVSGSRADLIETPVGGNTEPAHVQIVPAEVLMKPGESQTFRVRLFNSRGQFLSESKADYTLEGPGQIDSDGVFRAPEATQQAATIVTAKVGDLSGLARIRIVPDLPWRFDISDGLVPVTWIGERYRNIALDYDLLKKLEEEDALAARLYVHVMTGFTNDGTDVIAFNDRTPRKTWSGLQRYLKLEGKMRKVEEATALLDPALKILAREKVVDQWNYADGGATGVELNVHKGSREIDGNGVITKISTIPLGTRSQSWMGHPDLHDYTIQADICGSISDGKMPDIGVIAQRYTLDLMGESQQLQIRTWTPQLRMSKSTPVAWEPHVWYTLKFRASVEDGKAVLRGKVWKRGETEPEAWTVEAVDKSPNLTGSPGLFGNAKDAEIYVDNITVTPN